MAQPLKAEGEAEEGAEEKPQSQLLWSQAVAWAIVPSQKLARQIPCSQTLALKMPSSLTLFRSLFEIILLSFVCVY